MILEQEMMKLDNTARFIKMVADEELKVGNRPMGELNAELISLKFATDK
jgi:hypothetical protein